MLKNGWGGRAGSDFGDFGAGVEANPEVSGAPCSGHGSCSWEEPAAFNRGKKLRFKFTATPPEGLLLQNSGSTEERVLS